MKAGADGVAAVTGTPVRARPRQAGILERTATATVFRGQAAARRAEIAAAKRIVRCASGRKGSVASYTTDGELAALCRLSYRVPEGSAALEIGSYLGAASLFMAAGLSRRGSVLYCVDTWNNETMPEGTRDTYAEFGRNLGRLTDWIVPVRKRSEALVASDVPTPVGLVFIDGDHSYEACRGDFDRVQQFLTDDAIIAFHDSAAFEGVSRAIGEVLTERRWVVAGVVENLLWVRRSGWPEGTGRTEGSKG